MRIKDWIKILVLVGIAFLIPRTMLFFLICGLLDFRRSKRYQLVDVKRYFLGNGILTWVLSPFNLLMDLISQRNKRIYKFGNLSYSCQNEINKVIATAKNKPEIITALGNLMEEKKRGMIFFKWYGKNITNKALNIPEFHEQFRYIKTIGVSVFNKNQSTSIHYGPLRVTLRVLFNLNASFNNNIYIEAANQRHYWHDNPLFIFDDTLVHQSVNRSDQLRYCMFIDILRPSDYIPLLNSILSCLRVLIISFNRIFYKNWDMIK